MHHTGSFAREEQMGGRVPPGPGIGPVSFGHGSRVLDPRSKVWVEAGFVYGWVWDVAGHVSLIPGTPWTVRSMAGRGSSKTKGPGQDSQWLRSMGNYCWKTTQEVV